MQSFKSIMNNLPNKVNTFGALLEGKVSTWFGQGNFQDFARLEEEFLKIWCTVMTGFEALAWASQLKQKEEEYF